MRTICFAILASAVCSVAAAALDVPARSVPPAINGGLNEWGASAWVPLDPAGAGVGLRGAYEEYPDHEADVFFYWDADFLYIGLSVVDDVVDGARILPAEQVWERGGQRKDKMFYYDHLKVFVRGPEQPVGYNIWAGPDPYLWGGRQLEEPELQPPVRLASRREEGAFTYELAIPWSWLKIHPQSDMRLTALVLVSDADAPDIELAAKIARDESAWIWWKGSLDLRGKPPGLKPPPEPVEAEAVDPQADAPQVDTQLDDAIERLKERQRAAAAQAEAESGAAPQAVASAKDAGGQNAGAPSAVETPAPADTVEAAPSTASVVARLNRKLLARRTPKQWPAWAKGANQDESVSDAQVDSLLGQLTGQLYRLVDEGINSRTDGLVIDMAEKAGVRRGQARAFLQGLVAAADARSRRPEAAVYLDSISDQAEVEPKKTSALLRGIFAEAQKNFERNRPTTTKALIDKGRRAAKLSDQEVRRVLRHLVAGWEP